ncbi:MAG TPA: hypothetical protein VGG74_25580 [Kofleriaceae bacterium]|jgi:hypothetical protein
MHDFESLPVIALEHVTGGQSGFSLDGAKFCDTNFHQPLANQACKSAFAEGASQAASKLGAVPLFGTDGKGAIVPKSPSAK